MIGSLLWDDDRRAEWRRERLRVEEVRYVAAPIRYGRRSDSRGRTFTMVIDPKEPFGQAALVPCRSDIRSFADLQVEAEELWRAERKADSRDGIGGSWGCVGALFADEQDRGLMTQWSDWFGRSTSPVVPVDDDGILGIGWPSETSDSRPVDVDIILATATLATSRRPMNEEIANAWVDQNQGHERYFLENLRSGIRTKEDRAIWEHFRYSTARRLDQGLIQDVNDWLGGTERVTEGHIVSFKPPSRGTTRSEGDRRRDMTEPRARGC